MNSAVMTDEQDAAVFVYRIRNGMENQGHLVGSTGNLHDHETALVKFLLQAGLDVIILPPSRARNARTPDFLINDNPWEAKTIFKSRRQTVEHAFRSALRQAPNVIFDLRFLKNGAESAKNYILHEYYHNKNVRRVLIVTKDKRLLKYEK